MRTLEALEAILKSAQEPRAQVDAANTLAEYLVRADLVRCGLLVEETLVKARQLGYRLGEATALRQRAVCNLIQSDLAAADTDYQAALALSRQEGFGEIEASCLLGLSTLRRKVTDYPEAMSLLLEARRLRQQQGDVRGEVATLNNLGALCVELGSYDQATAFLLQGLKLSREHALPEYEIFCLSNFAGIKREAGELEGAIEDLQICLERALELENHYVRPHLLASLCETYLKQGQIEEALRVNEEALALASTGTDRQVELSLLVHLGIICDELGMPEAAEAAFTRALDRTKRLGDLERHLEALCQTAAFYQRQQRNAEARQAFQEARDQAQLAGARRHLARILRGLASLEPESLVHYESQAEAIEVELKEQALKSNQLAQEARGL